MCGILFTISKNSIAPLLSEHKSRLCARGPDYIGQLDLCLGPLHISVASTVLALRGDHLIKQPLTEPDSGSILCWNGEAWKLAGLSVVGNDAESIFSRLLEAASQPSAHEAILTCLREIEGPFAFVFLDKPNQMLYYGRDRLGRRSLLVNATGNSLTLCSISDHGSSSSAGIWSEVEADGIYSCELSCLLPTVLDSVSLVDPRHSSWIPIEYSGKELVSSLAIFNNKSEIPSDRDTLEAQSDSVEALAHHLDQSLQFRLVGIPDPPTIRSAKDSRVAVLFSGGLDCTVLARMVHDKVDPEQTIDLLNVAFENPRIASQLKVNIDGTLPDIYEVCPDRITGRKSFEELTEVCSSRVWRFVAINIPYTETMKHRAEIVSLMYPHNTEMDLSIAYALYFSSRGHGSAQTSASASPGPYDTPARVLLSGLGADELFGGYVRHTTAFSRNGYPGLVDELKLDMSRLGKRNLGRDDRVISHWGREVRFPYLDETLVKWAIKLPVWEKCDFHNSEQEDVPEPGKRVLRLLAERLGMVRVAREKKRAIQFGSRTAKMENSKTKGTHPIS